METLIGATAFNGRNGDGLITTFDAGSVNTPTQIKAGDRLLIIGIGAEILSVSTGNPVLGAPAQAFSPIAPRDGAICQEQDTDLSIYYYLALVFRKMED